METGKLIKELRITKGMTQEELAFKTDISTRTIQRIENGEVDPRAYTLQIIAKALDVDFSLFVKAGSDEDQEIQHTTDKVWLGLLHLSGLIPLIFPTVILWNLKRNKIKGIANHYRIVISFQLMILGIILGCLWIYWRVNMLTPLIGVLVANSLFTIFSALQVMGGKSPMPVSFLKSRNKNEKIE